MAHALEPRQGLRGAMKRYYYFAHRLIWVCTLQILSYRASQLPNYYVIKHNQNTSEVIQVVPQEVGWG